MTMLAIIAITPSTPLDVDRKCRDDRYRGGEVHHLQDGCGEGKPHVHAVIGLGIGIRPIMFGDMLFGPARFDPRHDQLESRRLRTSVLLR
jgi:hypothetical protein